MNKITANKSSFVPSKNVANVNKKKTIKALRKNSAERIKELNKMAKGDTKIRINNKVKDFSKIKKLAMMAPDIDNNDKIAMLKSKINAGTYKIDYDKLADKILSAEV